jgi:hypothetical protein
MYRTQREKIVFAALIFLFQYVASINSDRHLSFVWHLVNLTNLYLTSGGNLNLYNRLKVCYIISTCLHDKAKFGKRLMANKILLVASSSVPVSEGENLPPLMPIPSKKTDLEVLLLITFIYHL